MGLVDLLIGLKSSGRTSTKLDGKRPTILLSRRSLPVHHDPSPALRHSIRSPSMKPRSRFDYRHGASARTRRTPGGTRPIPSSRMINTLRGQLFNAPLPRRNTPPCTSKETAEVCPEELAPFRRWENCASCLMAEIQPTQQHLSPRVGECSSSWDLVLGLGLGPGSMLVLLLVRTIHVRRARSRRVAMAKSLLSECKACKATARRIAKVV